MIKGPTDYVPSVEVEVLSRRKAIPLDRSEGIYVRDIKSGKVRAVIGETYMLNQDEELFEKQLPQDVENLLNIRASIRSAEVASSYRKKYEVNFAFLSY